MPRSSTTATSNRDRCLVGWKWWRMVKKLRFWGWNHVRRQGISHGDLSCLCCLLCKTHSHGLQFISKRSQQIISLPPSPNQILKERLRSIQKIGNKCQLPTTMYPNLAVETLCYSHFKFSTWQHRRNVHQQSGCKAGLPIIKFSLKPTPTTKK